jgi:hypothetical protein
MATSRTGTASGGTAGQMARWGESHTGSVFPPPSSIAPLHRSAASAATQPATHNAIGSARAEGGEAKQAWNGPSERGGVAWRRARDEHRPPSTSSTCRRTRRKKAEREQLKQTEQKQNKPASWGRGQTGGSRRVAPSRFAHHGAPQASPHGVPEAAASLLAPYMTSSSQRKKIVG